MEIQENRIITRIETLAGFNMTPGNGITRFSYSDQDRLARNYIEQQCSLMGISVQTDPLGNIRARYNGQDNSLPPVWIGSHIDSVRNGGKYDGVVGVISALEVLNVLYENQITPLRPVELVIFAEEEGSNFGTTMIGSKAIVGKCDEEYLKQLTAETGHTAYEMIKSFGLAPEHLEQCRIKKGQIHAMIEMHVEQGAVLDRKGLIIGVVQAVAGMRTYRIEITGESNHAGATPMNMRHDPMTAAAELICDVEKYAQAEVYETTVATVGEIACLPNASNVIPQKIQFSVDIRDVQEDGIESIADYLRCRCTQLACERGVSITIHEIGSSKCIHLSPRITGLIEDVTRQKKLPYQCMNSGAVHDSAMLTEITDVGMIFVPSVNGKSHNPQEYTESTDIKHGAEVLLETVCRLMMEK